MKRLCLVLAFLFVLGCLTGCGSAPASQEAAPASLEPVAEDAAPVENQSSPASEEKSADPLPSPEEEPADPLPAPEPEYLGDFTVKTVDGGTFTLSEELKDHKLVLINLWASWCEPCNREFPYLQEALEQRSEDISLIALSIEPNDEDWILKDKAEELGISFPIGNVGDTGLERFATYSIPTTVVLDSSGRVLAAECGAKFSTEEFIAMFDAFTSQDYDPDLCTYRIKTMDANMNPLEGVQLSFRSDAGSVLASSGSDGEVIFTGPPAQYQIEVVKAPDGMVRRSDTEIITLPCSHTQAIIFEKGYSPSAESEEEPEIVYEGPEPDWIILDDFTVDTADGGTFTLSQVLEDHKLLIIKLFDTNCGSNVWEFPSLQKALGQRDDFAVLALSAAPSESLDVLKDYAEELGVSFPIARMEGTGLDCFLGQTLPMTILVDRHARVLCVEPSTLNRVESVHELLDQHSGKDYNPYECKYIFFAIDENGESVEGLVINLCTEDSCTPITTNDGGSAIFEGLPGRYHVQLVNVPEGLSIRDSADWYTEPYPQTFWIFFNGSIS